MDAGMRRSWKEGRGTWKAAPGWSPRALLQAPLPQLLAGITCPDLDPGSRLPPQGGLAAWGLHLGQPLLHAADVAVQPPGAAELGQTVFLVSQQGALWSAQGAECHLQRGHSVEESVEKGDHVLEPQPHPCQETAAVWLHLTPAELERWSHRSRRERIMRILSVGCQLSLLGWFFTLRYVLCLFFE